MTNTTSILTAVYRSPTWGPAGGSSDWPQSQCRQTTHHALWAQCCHLQQGRTNVRELLSEEVVVMLYAHAICDDPYCKTIQVDSFKIYHIEIVVPCHNLLRRRDWWYGIYKNTQKSTQITAQKKEICVSLKGMGRCRQERHIPPVLWTQTPDSKSSWNFGRCCRSIIFSSVKVRISLWSVARTCSQRSLRWKNR